MSIALVLRSSAIEENEFFTSIGLTHFASQAAQQMDFSPEEMEKAVERAWHLCLSAGIPVRNHFRRTYLCTDDGVVCDWRLSALGYYLVCFNGDERNPQVAGLQITLLKQLKKI